MLMRRPVASLDRSVRGEHIAHWVGACLHHRPCCHEIIVVLGTGHVFDSGLHLKDLFSAMVSLDRNEHSHEIARFFVGKVFGDPWRDRLYFERHVNGLR